MSTLHPPEGKPEPATDDVIRMDAPPTDGGRDAATATRRSDVDAWAKHAGPLSLPDTPEGAINLNVDGRELAGPLQGFGKLWQKVYRVTLFGVDASPEQVTAAWKQHYGEFWPEGNHFYAPLAGIAPGEVGLINADMPGKVKLSTGVMVLYADDVSFTFMTPQGHPFAGWITFSAERTDSGTTVAQVEVLIRAQDPASELGLALGGHRAEDRMWEQTLRNVAAHFEVDGADVRTVVTCVDKRRQWNRVGNLKHDAVMHTVAHLLAAPVRAVGLSWRGLLVAAALTLGLVQFAFMGAHREVIAPLLLFGVLGLVTAGVARSRQRVGGWVGALVGALAIVGNAPFIVSALQHPASTIDFVHTVFSVTGALGMAVAGIALIRRRIGEPRRLAVAGGSLLVLGTLVGIGAGVAATSDEAVTDDVEAPIEDFAFPEEVVVSPGATVFVDNRDPSTHTFFVEGTDIDVTLSADTARRVTVDVPAGRYQIRCRIPGHESMEGTLVVTSG